MEYTDKQYTIYKNKKTNNRILNFKNSLSELKKRFYRIKRERIKRQGNKNWKGYRKAIF